MGVENSAEDYVNQADKRRVWAILQGESMFDRQLNHEKH